MNTVEIFGGARGLWGVVAACVLMGCGARSADPCDRRPPPAADYGTCEALLGAYYDPVRGACIPVSGCSCDEACREDVPFADVASCEDACTGIDAR